MSNNDMSIEDKSSKSQQIMLQTQMAQQAQQAQQAQHAQQAQQAQHAQQAQQAQYKTENIQQSPIHIQQLSQQQHMNNTSLIPISNQSYKQNEYIYNNENLRKRGNEYNFFDRMNLKRTEVIKLSLFSLVIVLGISIDRMLTYYLSKYIGDNILTDFQEFLLRVSYPITIFLLLWIFKAI
jgi:actin-related protein